MASEPGGAYISIAGLYNGVGEKSHVAKIPSAVNVNVKGVDAAHGI